MVYLSCTQGEARAAHLPWAIHRWPLRARESTLLSAEMVPVSPKLLRNMNGERGMPAPTVLVGAMASNNCRDGLNKENLKIEPHTIIADVIHIEAHPFIIS